MDQNLTFVGKKTCTKMATLVNGTETYNLRTLIFFCQGSFWALSFEPSSKPVDPPFLKRGGFGALNSTMAACF